MSETPKKSSRPARPRARAKAPASARSSADATTLAASSTPHSHTVGLSSQRPLPSQFAKGDFTMSDPEVEAVASERPVSGRDLRTVQCDLTISKHVTAASGAGFIPIPVLDFVTVTGVQIDLLYRLCRIYEVDFSKEAARSVISSLVGAAVPGIESTLVGSSVKLIPIFGTAVGLFVTPAVAGASTYALGKVFVQHLESGGTLLSFNAAKMKAHFERALAESKQKLRRKKPVIAEPLPAEAE